VKSRYPWIKFKTTLVHFKSTTFLTILLFESLVFTKY